MWSHVLQGIAGYLLSFFFSSEDFFEVFLDPSPLKSSLLLAPLLFEPPPLFEPSPLLDPSPSESSELLEVFELFEPLLPLLEELVFFLGVSESSVSSVSLDALASFELPLDLPSFLEPPSSSDSEAVLCFVEPLCAEAVPVLPLSPFARAALAASLLSLASFPFGSGTGRITAGVALGTRLTRSIGLFGRCLGIWASEAYF